jgi:hypothetical protein
MPKKTAANSDDSKLAKEKAALEKKIQNELAKAWADPSVKLYFDKRVEKEESQRHLNQLKHENDALETEFVHLVEAVVEKLPSSELSLTALDRISEMSSKFQDRKQKRSTVLEMGEVLKDDLKDECDKVVASLTRKQKDLSTHTSENIKQQIKGLQHQFEECFTDQFEKYLERRLENEINSKSKKLRKLIDKPVEEFTQEVVKQAKKVDVIEDTTINSMYKIANFLNKGELDISYWQRMKILSQNFKQYVNDNSQFSNNPKNLENLCLKIKAALEKGEPDKVSDLLDHYFDTQQKRMEAAIIEVEGAIDNAMKKDGEQFVDELLLNAEKELSKKSPLYKNAKAMGTMVRRADTVVSYFQVMTTEKEKPKKSSPPSTMESSKKKNKNKREKN